MENLQMKTHKRGWARISKKPFWTTFILCIIAALLNYALEYFAAYIIKIPLFLDTIFTITITFYCGPIPALFSTILYSIPSSLIVNAPIYMLFNFCSLAIIFITYGLMRYNEKNNNSKLLTFLYLILAALLAGFVSSIIGGFIHTIALLLYPDVVGEITTEKFVLSLFSKNGNLILSAILGRIPTTCLDRVISNLVGWGLYTLLLKFDKNHR